MLKLSDLARRPDFKIGPVLVSPSRRLVEGPAGKATLEPLVMQVFLMLVDARGQVVTREDLFNQVWGGAMVGDDSLNRAIGRVRRIEAETCPGLFEVETIPRTGYRLLGQAVATGQADAVERLARSRLPRRVVIGGSLAAASVAGAGLWWSTDRKQHRFNELMAKGRAALDYGDPDELSGEYFRQALAVRPNDSVAQGLLAYALSLRVDNGLWENVGLSVDEAQLAIRNALKSDPANPFARVAKTILESATLDLAANEARLRKILADYPNNTEAMRSLWNLLQCAGRSLEALALVERVIELKPLAAMNNYPWAQLLWIVGKHAEADRVIQRAMQLWPSHRFVRFARFIIFAFTGRERLALAMLESRATAPQNYSPEAIALWKISLPALEERSAAKVAAARAANIDAPRGNLRLTSQAVMTLSSLGEIDAAFEVANRLLLFREHGATSQLAAQRPMKKSIAWIFAPWLFIPPLAPLRADPRFESLCDGIGLTEYWRQVGVVPDYLKQRP